MRAAAKLALGALGLAALAWLCLGHHGPPGCVAVGQIVNGEMCR